MARLVYSPAPERRRWAKDSFTHLYPDPDRQAHPVSARSGRAWTTAAWNGERTPGECITMVVEQLIYEVTIDRDTRSARSAASVKNDRNVRARPERG
jgi:hypothetical protein